MKTNITLLAFSFILVNQINAQDANVIMKLAMQASDKVQQGYYEVTSNMKYMTDMDTSTRRYRSWFKRLPEDECFGFAFHTNQFYEGNFRNYRMYTGNELVGGSDSMVTVTSVDKWKEHILDIKHNYDSYSPFTEPKDVFPSFKEIKKGKIQLTLLPDEAMKTGMSYHILEKSEVENDPEEPMQIINEEKHYWVDQQSHLIIQYDRMVALAMNGDTMVQYERLTLDTFFINEPIDESKLTLASLPSHTTIKDYTPYKEIPLLTNNSPAPTWTLPSLSNDTVRLEALKGKLVLVDFFYKSCYPCMQAVPVLQALHEKYKDQGLVVIGINPVDKNTEELATFLENRNVTYPVVFSDKELPATYHVSGYPTLYLIDKNGMIVHGSAGFGPVTEGRLESLITMHLKHMN